MKLSKKPFAFPFVLEYLESLQPVVRPMFGCHAVYLAEKIVLATRQKGGGSDDGVWIATSVEHHASLRKELKSITSIQVLGNGKETNWQVIPQSSESFEEDVMKLIDLIRKGDNRIGKIPKARTSRPKGAITRKR